MEKISDRVLHKDLNHIAGYHDGKQIFISGKHDDAYVSLHELIHDEIFKKCLDGQILHVLSSVSELELFQNKKSEIEKIQRFLWKDSVLAHERAATYIGIQSLRLQSDRVRVLHLLDPEYLSYFNFFSDIIDEITESSFLRYSIAWAVTSWAFSSTRAQIETSKWLDLDCYTSIAGPTDRIDVWQTLGVNNCREWIAKSTNIVASRFELKAANFNFDEYWESLAPRDLRHLDSEIGRQLSLDILNLMNLPVCNARISDTEFGRAALAAGITFNFQENTYLPINKFDYSTDLSDGRILSNAEYADNLKIFGSDLIDGYLLSSQEFQETLLQFLGKEIHMAVVVKSESEAHIFIWQSKDERPLPLGLNYRINVLEINDILNSLISFYKKSGIFYPIMMCYDISYYFEADNRVIINSLPEELKLAFLPNDYNDEWIESPHIFLHLFASSAFSKIMQEFKGTLETGLVSLIEFKDGYDVSFICSVFYVDKIKSLKFMRIDPRMSIAYRSELIQKLELSGSITVKDFKYRSFTMRHLIHSTWSVFAR